MHFKKNDTIEGYTVAFQHKKGAYAETYRVKDRDGKTRFLKLINYSKLHRQQMDEQGSVIEIEIAQQLQHHNLCQYFDSGYLTINGGQYAYFVTEFVSGETLAERLVRNDDISVYEIKTIAKATLSALSFLHSRPTPIVHNEVTIQNLLINLVGGLSDLKLIDFGHARFLNQQPQKPQIEGLNPFYMAPERFSGVNTVQSDLYAVGAIMYLLLYGKLPWFVDTSGKKEEDAIDIILAERDKQLAFPKTDIFELDTQLINTISKSLSYDAEDRFQSADDFMEAIDGNLKVEEQSPQRKKLSDEKEKVSPKLQARKKEGTGFASVAGMDELKRQLQEDVIDPLHRPEEYKRYGITIPNGMLLYGPPSCGKTFFAKHFAEEVGFNFMCITPATLKSRYVNATQENIAKMFDEAEKNAPTVIFIDEINELVPNRDGDVHEMSRSAVNEMLAQMDRTGEKKIFIIGATNMPNQIDPAILRAGRLDRKYYVGVPDQAARISLFKLYLKSRPYDFGIDYEELARLSENYVSADIQLIVNDASRKALHEHSNITMQHLTEAIKQTQPSLSVNELRKYERIHAMMKGKVKEQPQEKRPRIGFHA